MAQYDFLKGGRQPALLWIFPLSKMSLLRTDMQLKELLGGNETLGRAGGNSRRKLRDSHGFSSQSEQDKQGQETNTKICLEHPVYSQKCPFLPKDDELLLQHRN